MPSSKPFELIRWDSPEQPTEDFWQGWMQREKMKAVSETLPLGTQTQEMKHATPLVRVVLKGCLQCSFPGYGVVDLAPGDCLEIAAHTQHDLKVTGSEAAQLLTGHKM